MHLMKVDPRALKDNPDRTRQTKSTPQADALLLATIKAVGIVQPPIVFPETGGGNGYIVNAGHRRIRQAIAAGLDEIDVLVDAAANDNGAMRSIVENIAREALNPVDLWRAIERLVALGWTEEAIGVALAQPVRQIRKLRLLSNILPAMLDSMAKGDMPNEQQLRTIAAASLDEQKEVWKAHKPKKGDPQVSWWSIANSLTKKRMYARDASFGADLAQAYASMPPLRLRLRGDRDRGRAFEEPSSGNWPAPYGALEMSHDLSLAQNHAFQLARTLMVPVTIFQVDGEYGVLPSDELDDADGIEPIFEYDPYERSLALRA